MKTITLTEYLFLCLKYMSLRDVAIGLTMLCLILLVIQLLELGFKGLFLAGLLFAVYKVASLLASVLIQLVSGGHENENRSIPAYHVA